MEAPIGPPTKGPTRYGNQPVMLAGPHPITRVTRRGPMSRAGLIPAPVRAPRSATIQPIAQPTRGATADPGTLLFGWVMAKTTKQRNAVPIASIAKAWKEFATPSLCYGMKCLRRRSKYLKCRTDKYIISNGSINLPPVVTEPDKTMNAIRITPYYTLILLKIPDCPKENNHVEDACQDTPNDLGKPVYTHIPHGKVIGAYQCERQANGRIEVTTRGAAGGVKSNHTPKDPQSCGLPVPAL